MIQQRMPALAGILLLVVLALVQQWATTTGLISPFVLPPASEILAAIPGLFTDEGLIARFGITFGITLLATLISILVGLPLGWLLYRHRAFGAAYESWLGAIFSAPIILLYPLFLVVGVTPIILSTYRGLLGVPPVYVRVARSLNMPERDIPWKVLAPAALPSIFTGVRLTLIYAMINTVAMEFLISIGGLGYLVGDLYDRYYIPDMYAAVGFVILTSVIFFSTIDRIEAWLKR